MNIIHLLQINRKAPKKRRLTHRFRRVGRPDLYFYMEYVFIPICQTNDRYILLTATFSLKSYSSLIVSETAIPQILLAGAKGASSAVNTSSASIPPMDAKGICHAVPQ